MASKQGPDLDVSVVIPFSDDEDRVGRLSRRIAEHLRALDLKFEILAVDEGSGDNSTAVLALLRTRLPELALMQAARPSQGFASGAAVARGSVLWLIDAVREDVPVAPFWWAYMRLRSDVADAVLMEGRYVVCRRTRVWRVLDAIRGRAGTFERRFLRRAAALRLRVQTPHGPASGASRGLVRLLETLTPARFQGLLRSRA